MTSNDFYDVGYGRFASAFIKISMDGTPQHLFSILEIQGNGQDIPFTTAASFEGVPSPLPYGPSAFQGYFRPVGRANGDVVALGGDTTLGSTYYVLLSKPSGGSWALEATNTDGMPMTLGVCSLENDIYVLTASTAASPLTYSIVHHPQNGSPETIPLPPELGPTTFACRPSHGQVFVGGVTGLMPGEPLWSAPGALYRMDVTTKVVSQIPLPAKTPQLEAIDWVGDLTVVLTWGTDPTTETGHHLFILQEETLVRELVLPDGSEAVRVTGMTVDHGGILLVGTDNIPEDPYFQGKIGRLQDPVNGNVVWQDLPYWSINRVWSDDKAIFVDGQGHIQACSNGTD